MAIEGKARNELRAHESSYGRFVGMMKWGTILSVIVAAIVIFVISS